MLADLLALVEALMDDHRWHLWDCSHCLEALWDAPVLHADSLAPVDALIEADVLADSLHLSMRSLRQMYLDS